MTRLRGRMVIRRFRISRIGCRCVVMCVGMPDYGFTVKWWVGVECAPPQPKTGVLQTLGLTRAQPTQLCENGMPGGTRTPNAQFLRLTPLPIGLQAQRNGGAGRSRTDS